MNYLTYHEFVLEFLENGFCFNDDLINGKSRFGYLDPDLQNCVKEKVRKICLQIMKILLVEYITIPSMQKEVAYMILVSARLICGFSEGQIFPIRRKFGIEISNKTRFEESILHIMSELQVGPSSNNSSIGLQYYSSGSRKTGSSSAAVAKVFTTPPNSNFNSEVVKYMDVNPNEANGNSCRSSEYEINLKPFVLTNTETAPSPKDVVRNLSKEKNYTPSNQKLNDMRIKLDEKIISPQDRKAIKTLVKKKEGSYGQTRRKDVNNFNSKADGNFMRKSTYVVLEEKKAGIVPSPILRERELRGGNMNSSYVAKTRYRNRKSIGPEDRESAGRAKKLQDQRIKSSLIEQQAYVSLADEYKKLKQKSIQKVSNCDGFERERGGGQGDITLSGIDKVSIDSRRRELRTSNYYQEQNNQSKRQYSRPRTPNIDENPGWQTDRYANRRRRSPLYPRGDSRNNHRRESSIDISQQIMTDRGEYYKRSCNAFDRCNPEKQGISSSTFFHKERDFSSKQSRKREASFNRIRRFSNIGSYGGNKYYSPSSNTGETGQPKELKCKKVSVPLLKLSRSRIEKMNDRNVSPVVYPRVQTSRDRRASSRNRNYMDMDYPRAPLTDRHRPTPQENYIKLEGVDEFRDNSRYRMGKKASNKLEYFSPTTYSYKSKDASQKQINRMSQDMNMRYSNCGQNRRKPSPYAHQRRVRDSYKRDNSSKRYYYKDKNISESYDRSNYPKDPEKVITPSYNKKSGMYNRGSGRFSNYDSKENYQENYNYYI